MGTPGDDNRTPRNEDAFKNLERAWINDDLDFWAVDGFRVLPNKHPDVMPSRIGQ